MTNRNDVGAERVAGNRKHGLAWLPWVSLLALALIALLTFLFLQNVTDENDKKGIDVTDDEIAPGTAGADPQDNVTATTAAVGNNRGSNTVATAPAATSPLRTAAGVDVFGAATSNQLAPLVGQPVTGSGVSVLSVVANEGFWVGETTNQVFVHLTPAARGTGESGVQVAAGQRVDFAGQLTRAPANTLDLGVEAGEGADRLKTEGAYVEATSFKIL